MLPVGVCVWSAAGVPVADGGHSESDARGHLPACRVRRGAAVSGACRGFCVVAQGAIPSVVVRVLAGAKNSEKG